jgi:Na+/glutamate symporter
MKDKARSFALAVVGSATGMLVGFYLGYKWIENKLLTPWPKENKWEQAADALTERKQMGEILLPCFVGGLITAVVASYILYQKVDQLIPDLGTKIGLAKALLGAYQSRQSALNAGGGGVYYNTTLTPW